MKSCSTTRRSVFASGSFGAQRVLLLLFIGCALFSGCESSKITNERVVKQNGKASVEANVNSDISFEFTDKTRESGVAFTYANGEECGHFSILESLGGGVGIFDFDLDRNEDLFLPGGGTFDESPSPAGLCPGLYRNAGGWRFAGVGSLAGVSESPHYSHGACIADYDNDGFPDVLVTGFGQLKLWKNNGDGTFIETAHLSNVVDLKWSSSAAWGDVNDDGAVDLYVAHYVNWSFDNHPFCQGPGPDLREVCPPRQYDGVSDLLYISNGDGTFHDGTSDWGLSPNGKGLAVLIADLDLDSDLDIYVTNDTVENFLYENMGDRYEDVSLMSGSSVSEKGVPEGSMGVDMLDYNRDGAPDLWVVNYENESAALYENLGHLRYRHVSQRTGVTGAGAGLFVGWGTCCFDCDMNGFDDIFVSNGHVIRYPVNSPVEQLPLLLANINGERFENVAAKAGSYMTSVHKGRGAAMGDLDNDGAIDLVVSNNNQPVSLLRNTTKQAGQWLAVELSGRKASRDPVGAIVTLDSGDFRQVKQWRSGGSYASTNSRKIFFGIPVGLRPDRIEIRWPSGTVQVVDSPVPNHVLHVVESEIVDSSQGLPQHHFVQ
jgi:enediyne biosynthesis protein E4